ncbi:TPA: hypothetical protein DDZ10_04610 [Candidatus Uhrbacteria bacterium]|nr:MAG: hypothetical protein UY79_C0005G0016 [Parcubacteria group bacterium GW2011_GWA2_53_21]HBL39917.1 hypothetical protein [Candidatus Uhrbacteria bacterium]
MKRTIKQLMNEVSGTPTFGASSSDQIEAGRLTLLETLGAGDIVRPTYTFKDYADFAASFAFHSVARPFAVGFSSLVLALGGWVVAVNAASDSVPGDALYPVKIATERVQLRFTTSSEQRAKLHIEFAGRRLDEVGAVQSSDRAGKNVRVQNALESFRKEIAFAQTEFGSASKKNPDSASQIAAYVDEKSDAYTDQIRSRLASEDVQSSDEVRAQAEAAQNEAVAVGRETVRVLVDAHDESLENKSNDQLKGLFRSDLNDVQAQLSVVRSRLATVKNVLLERDLGDDLETLAGEIVSKIEARLLDVQPEIDKATNTLAVGGYRSTFDTMGELKDTMNVVHGLLAQLEVQISVALSQEIPE